MKKYNVTNDNCTISTFEKMSEAMNYLCERLTEGEREFIDIVENGVQIFTIKFRLIHGKLNVVAFLKSA